MDLAHRVARRFIAEKLTKQWLMAVKRGWLAILKSSDEPYKKFKMLHRFLDKLREQLIFQKHGFGLRFEGTSEREAFEQALKAAKAKLVSANEAYEADRKREYDTNIARQEFFARIEDQTGDRIQRMGLDEYLKKYPDYEPYAQAFREAIDASGKWIYGDGFLRQLRPATKAFESMMQILYAEAKALKEYEEAGGKLLDISREKVFSLGRVKVVVVDDNLSRGNIRAYIKNLDRAHALLKAKGFEKVWYGVVFVEGENHKLTDKETALAKEYGYSISGSAGLYKSGPNEVYIQQPPGPHVTATMIHELGHRYWFKILTSEQRARFNALVRTKETPKYRDFPQGPVTEEGEYKPVFPVSLYGRSNIEEAFAEVFMQYVLGGKITRDQVESFRSVLARSQRHYRYNNRKLKQPNDGYSLTRLSIATIS